MTAIRQILSDRVLATAMAVVMAYVVVLQVLVGSYARASNIGLAGDSFHVICASSGTANTISDESESPLKKKAECPCALLCRLANSATPAIIAALPLVIRMAALDDKPNPSRVDTVSPSSQRRLLAEPRAPPSIA